MSGTKTAKNTPKAGICSAFCLVTVFNMVLFGVSAYLFVRSRGSSDNGQQKVHIQETNQNNMPPTPIILGNVHSRSDADTLLPKVIVTELPASAQFAQSLPECNDPVWCTIEMPKKSYYRFDAPIDAFKWRVAQIQAANGEQVLLRRVMKQFPGHSDFLDGDITFRKLHSIFDFFVDERRDLTPLIAPHTTFTSNVGSRRLEAEAQPVHSAAKLVNGKMKYPWELEGKRVIPEPYDFRSVNRSAVVSVGYTAYTRDSQTYFSGNRVGGAFIDRNVFFRYWRAVKDKIDLPFVSICTLNENWGMLSTMFPNRTAGWGRCCDQPKDRIVQEFLDHPKTLMLVTNQHVNISHPKLMIMPRGIPLTWGFTRMMIWDAMRLVLQSHKKQKLLFAAASSWGPRPQILRCISDKVPAELFDGHVRTPKTNRLSREQYYQKLGTTMFGVGLPGLGYDTFRAWELMTMGSIVVLERGVGFDRTMYRLPALFVEDFYDITPDLLRQAYVEALYRADDFEFERLRQSFWYGVISNVSATMSVQTILDKFPMEAEEPNFARPREPYECGKTNTCGKGTKRTPKMSC